MNAPPLTTSCLSRAALLLGGIIGLGALAAPSVASAHTIQICWQDNGGVTTFYAGTYHSPTEGPSPYGGIIVDGFDYPFSGYILPGALPANASCYTQINYTSGGNQGYNPDGFANPGVNHFQTFTSSFPPGAHTIDFTTTSAIQYPWGPFPDLTFGGGTCPDADFDGICNDQDACPLDAANDGDGDGICGNVDNCPNNFNPNQVDANGNGQGDVCEGDVCGNGLVTGSEQCDDGNIAGGDGCSAICTLEAPPCGDADGDGFTDATCGGNDCDDANVSIFPGNIEFLCDGVDNDCSTATGDDVNNDGDPVSYCNGDCADNDAGRYPGNTEVLCDGVDQNCNGNIDDNQDQDGDGVSFCAGDCDDTNVSIFPGNAEVLCDGVDNNCNGIADDDVDADVDLVSFCAGDCDDTNASNYPGNLEDCDRADNDCDGVIPGDEIDGDGDGLTSCEGDCDDGAATTYPGAAELCDRIDNDCDGVLPGDEIDNDSDAQTECEGDCDDADAANYTGGVEVCDGQDNNCDSAIDEGFDLDGDGVTSCAGDNCLDDANPGQEDGDGDGAGDVCDPFPCDADDDLDGDGVGGDVDLCPGTISDSAAGVPSRSLKSNRWIDSDGDGTFEQASPGNGGPVGGYTTIDTWGCSCADIIDAMGLGNGHTKSGCSNGAMDEWVNEESLDLLATNTSACLVLPVDDDEDSDSDDDSDSDSD